ncbi:MAG: MBL fold metallo-hydrolase [Eubacteriales bacterium]|nr:MBL fold metallo-hydrolase [Eubacteriales bacterium]
MAENQAGIKVNCFVVGMVQTNFYFLYREGSSETIVFDPADLGGRLCDELEKRGLTVKAIFLTHAHFDHIMGLEEMKERTGAPVYACIHEKRLCESPRLNESVSIGRPCTVSVDHWVDDGDEVECAGIRLRTIFTPGHTEGSCAYYIEDGHILISGDTLFQSSIGRSDLPTGDQDTLFKSIRTRLYTLPDDTTVFSGHGDETTIAYEKKHNWFVRA